MTRDDIIRMAREANLPACHASHPVALARFAALVAAAECNKLAAWMIKRSYATGHGDTTEDLLKELDWQIAERIAAEREAISKSLDKQADLACDDIDRQWAQEMAAAVRARGEK